MKKLAYALVLTGLVAVPALAQAEEAASPHTFSANITLATDYIFRGLTQTGHQPAIQGGIDYTHASGLYLGTWASNVSWVKEGLYKDNSSMEIDLYGGYRGSLPADIGYDVGVITYYYPGDKNTTNNFASPNTTEAYASASWKFLSLKYSHVVSSHFVGWEGPNGEKTQNSNYIELNANYDLGGGWGVLGHVGHQKVNNLSVADYNDWKLGVSKNIGFGTVTLAYSDTDINDPIYTVAGEELGKGRAVLSFSKSF